MFLPAGQGRDLERLAYRNPGLETDLGVGLWAWPLPMDYDGDGDLDLVVACPDKPSNGVYLFENPGSGAGGDPRPVFRSAVRIGDAENNMRLSFVDGAARVLVPGKEYTDFRASGFREKKEIYSQENVHDRSVRANQWGYADWDGDGAVDLIVGVGDWNVYGWDFAYDRSGVWRNGPLHGYVYWLRNRGSTAEPDYAGAELLRANGAAVDVYGRPSPCVADFDGDGDLDLLCGEFLDGFTYFENTGSRTHPVLAAGRRLRDELGEILRMDLQMIVPTAIDWDGDGDTDLVVGDEDGRVALLEHSGAVRQGTPVFRKPYYFRQEAAELKCGALATPCVLDWDGDGRDDILCGNTAGRIGFFRNLGGEEKLPRWAAPEPVTVGGSVFRIQAGDNGSIQGPCEAKWGYTTLTAADWDGDGLPDLLVNSILGEVLCLLGKQPRGSLDLEEPVPLRVRWEGEARYPAWRWRAPAAGELVTQWRTTPVAVDFTGDGRMDLVMLDHEGYLALFERAGDGDPFEVLPGKRIFCDENLEPLRLNARTAGGSGRRKLAVVDWDGDGKLDLLVNGANAEWYRQVDRRDGRVILRRLGPLAKRNVVGHTSSPAAADWNRDGKPDLLLGAEDGFLYHVFHEETVTYEEENPAAGPLDARAEEQGEARPGLQRIEFIYESAPFPECHASTIVETGAGLAAAWFGGTEEGHEDVGIWVSRHDGERWGTPFEVADGVQFDGLRYPCWNPVLHQEPGGPLQLYYKCGPSPSRWWGMRMESFDGGRTWNEAARLPEGIQGPVRNKPVRLDDGVLLCGSSREDAGWRVYFERSTDLGRTWMRVGPLETGGFEAIQPTILRHPEGLLQALCRTKESVVAQTWSRDGGKSWSALEKTMLPNPSSGIDGVTLAGGRHLLVYNHTVRGAGSPRNREMLNVALSEDGVEWQPALILEREAGGEFSYPAVIQTADGKVHVTYTWKRRRIRHAVLDPAALRVQSYREDGGWPFEAGGEEKPQAQ